MRRFLVLFALPLLMAAGGGEKKRLCEGDWPKNKHPSQKESAACTKYWYDTYIGGPTNDDPGEPGSEVNAFTSEELRNMSNNAVDAEETDSDVTVASRLREYLDRAAGHKLEMYDWGTSASIEPLLAKIFAGSKLTPDEIKKVSPMGLHKLRNAVYARHGRAFKNPDLQTFFYGDRKQNGKSENTKLLPRKVNSDFKDSDLDAADKFNIDLLAKAEQAGGKR